MQGLFCFRVIGVFRGSGGLDRVALCLLVFLATNSRLAAQLPTPRFDRLSPLGAAAGSTLEVEVQGADLEEVKSLLFDQPGLSGEPVPMKERFFKVTVAPNVPVGTYDVRLVGRFGVSNPRLLAVSKELVDVPEVEPNNDGATAQLVPINSAIQGTSDNNDQDWYRIALIDDLRETNPPSNPELLDALAKDFVEHHFDIKHMVRTIVTSQVYQLASEPIEQNKHDHTNFARFYARRMIAEVLLDSLDQASGTKTRFGNVAGTARAIDLPHENFGSYFLDTFDRPRRVTSCECERSSGGTLAQVLLLANSDEIENKVSSGEGKVARMLKDKKSDQEIVEDIYLGALSRKPTAEEQAVFTTFLATVVTKPEERQAALEDVLWTVVNTKEFMFTH